MFFEKKLPKRGAFVENFNEDFIQNTEK